MCLASSLVMKTCKTDHCGGHL